MLNRMQSFFIILFYQSSFAVLYSFLSVVHSPRFSLLYSLKEFSPLCQGLTFCWGESKVSAFTKLTFKSYSVNSASSPRRKHRGHNFCCLQCLATGLLSLSTLNLLHPVSTCSTCSLLSCS